MVYSLACRFALFQMIVLFLCSSVCSSAAVIHVRPDGDDLSNGLSWESAKRTVQSGIDSAQAGDQVWVKGGPDCVYRERITLKSGVALYGGFTGEEASLDERPAFPRGKGDAYESSLDGDYQGRVVTIQANAEAGTVIDGFSIVNGTSEDGAGIFSQYGSPRISNNIIRQNNGYSENRGGGGIHCLGGEPHILRNIISNNSTDGDYYVGGGGVYCEGGAPIIEGNIIFDNTAASSHYSHGGGIYCSGGGVIKGNTVSGNRAYGSSYRSVGLGGGIYCAGSASVVGNNIIGNSATEGGGVYAEGSVDVTNNTLVGNYRSGISCYGSPQISNNIIAFGHRGVTLDWGFDEPQLRNNCVYGNADADYHRILPGEGDFSLDPQLAAAAYGNVHLQPFSPCIDAGWGQAPGIPDVDIDGEGRIFGKGLDVGADEWTGESQNASPVIVRVSPDGDDEEDGLSWGHAKRTLSAATQAVADGGEVWVAAGTYDENIRVPMFVHVYGGFSGSEHSRDDRDWLLSQSQLMGQSDQPTVTMFGAGYLLSSFDGFVIHNRSGIVTDSSPTICNNTLVGQQGFWNAGISNFQGAPRIASNNISGFGSGVYCAAGAMPSISGNTISSNTGRGIYCDWAVTSTIIGNVISGNSGGGIHSEGYVTLQLLSNRFVQNSAVYGAAICLEGTEIQAMVLGNIIENNTALEYGGGIYSDSMFTLIRGNTLYGNTAGSEGGGIYCIDSSSISNNIIAFGSSGIYAGDHSDTFLRNNCVHDNTDYDYSGVYPGEGDIFMNPLLVNPAQGDYHLAPGSPCINAGWNDEAYGLLFDIDGQGRICQGRVDIGADEYWPAKPSIFDFKAAADGALVSREGSTVTASFADCFYIGAENRSGGIRVEKKSHSVIEGMSVALSGRLQTNADGEKCIAADTVVATGAASLPPVGIANRYAGGSDMVYDALTGVGQRGIFGSLGLNNIGMLVSVWGRVTASGRGWFYLDDGSGVQDGTGVVGLYVDIGESATPSIGSQVSVTGISSCEYYLGNLVNVILARSSSDIQILQTGNTQLRTLSDDAPSPRR